VRLATAEDIEAVNRIINDPSVRPTIGGEGYLDSSALITDRRNRIIFDERGGACFAWRGPGIFEGHSFFLVRGREALSAGREAISLLDYRMIWGLTPTKNGNADWFRSVRWFNRQLGFKSHGMIDTPDQGRCELFVLEN
jgi:hypothetical protein